MSVDPQHLLRELFATAIDAAHPGKSSNPTCLPTAVAV